MKELEPIRLSLFPGETASAPPEIATEVKTARLWFDGGTFPGNPSHGGGGAVLEIDGEEYSFSEYLGNRVTNNLAEYGGLLLGLKKALELGVTHLEVFGDSLPDSRQSNGRDLLLSERGVDSPPLWREARPGKAGATLPLAGRFVFCEFE